MSPGYVRRQLLILLISSARNWTWIFLANWNTMYDKLRSSCWLRRDKKNEQVCRNVSAFHHLEVYPKIIWRVQRVPGASWGPVKVPWHDTPSHTPHSPRTQQIGNHQGGHSRALDQDHCGQCHMKRISQDNKTLRRRIGSTWQHWVLFTSSLLICWFT